MLNKLKKSLIILLSCIAINYSISAAELQARAKSSSQYFMDSSRILSSYYATSATVSLNSGFAIDKNTGAQFTGTYVEFNEVGNPQVIRNFKNGSPDGKWYFFNESRGLTRVTNYSNGVKDGEEIEFNDNGISKSIKQYQNGLLNGASYDFDSTGRLTSSITYVNNAKTGKELKYQNGVVSEERNYQNSSLNGEMKAYYPSGQVSTEGNYETVNGLGNILTVQLNLKKIMLTV